MEVVNAKTGTCSAKSALEIFFFVVGINATHISGSGEYRSRRPFRRFSLCGCLAEKAQG